MSETRQPSDRAAERAIEAVSRSKTAMRFSISLAAIVFGIYYFWSQHHPTAMTGDQGGPASV